MNIPNKGTSTYNTLRNTIHSNFTKKIGSEIDAMTFGKKKSFQHRLMSQYRNINIREFDNESIQFTFGFYGKPIYKYEFSKKTLSSNSVKIMYPKDKHGFNVNKEGIDKHYHSPPLSYKALVDVLSIITQINSLEELTKTTPIITRPQTINLPNTTIYDSESDDGDDLNEDEILAQEGW